MSSMSPSEERFALVDCNSFYCSCERVFSPRLNGKPVVVLSNNDGCIVSLTKEAKAVGLQMGGPIFQAKDLVRAHGVAVFSSNYTLYGDMSARVMATLSEFTPELEVYSIDEAFLSLRGFTGRNLSEYGTLIRNEVKQCTGIPVSVGIAPTKVLAKAANKIAKKLGSGVFDFHSREQTEEALKIFPVEDLWGIGRQSQKKLNAHGVMSAFDLMKMKRNLAQKLLTIVGVRIQEELNGISCIGLDLFSKPKKQIISSRSFGELLTEIGPIEEAISNHVSRAAEKLRSQNSVCGGIMVFIHTNPFREQDQQYYRQTSRTFLMSENRTNRMIGAALDGLKEIYRSGFRYKKCGVMLFDLTPENELQPALFDHAISERLGLVMKSMDEINHQYGASFVKFGSCGTKTHWQMRAEARSPRYTTVWEELLSIR